MRCMKRAGLIFGAALCAVLLFSGCGDADIPAASSKASHIVLQADSSAQISSRPASAAAASSAAGSPAGRGNGNENVVNPVSTDSEAFNKKFKNNPIDAKYAAEMDNAASTTDIVKVSDKYTDVWSKEIDHAYAELKKALASDTGKWSGVESGQKAWEAGKDAEIQKINTQAQADGGSMARITSASETMEYYRSRAAELYRILYGAEPDFTYAFSAN